MKQLLILAAIFLQASPQPVSIPIKNPSFEQGTSGWQFGPSSGVIQSGGKLVADAGYGGTFSQQLAITPMELQSPAQGYAGSLDEVYVLTFSAANYFPQYPGYYTAKVSFGTQELCEASGWGMAEFSRVTLICPSPNYLVRYRELGGSGGPAQGQQPFTISFHVDGWTLLFDDVSLSFTPETK